MSEEFYDFTIGKRDDKYYAFANTKYAKQLLRAFGYENFCCSSLEEMKHILKDDHACNYDIEPDCV